MAAGHVSEIFFLNFIACYYFSPILHLQNVLYGTFISPRITFVTHVTIKTKDETNLCSGRGRKSDTLTINYNSSEI